MKNGIIVVALASLWASCSPRSIRAQPVEGPMLNAIYFCYPEGLSLEECAELGINVITHQPREPTIEKAKAYIERAHQLGIRILPYVSAEKAWDDFMTVWERNSAGSVPYYLNVQPKEHREWVIWRPDGKHQIRYGMYKTDENGKEYPFWPDPLLRGAWYLCANAVGYPDAVLKGCRETMEMGADGLFIDNASANRLTSVAKCAGPEQGKHQHLYPDQDNRFAYVRLLHQIRDLVKSYGKDKIAFYNGGVDPAFEDCRDADMLESFISNASQDRWHSWDTIKAWANRYGDERARGRVVTVLSYITGNHRPPKDDLYYCFACAHWGGFLWGGASGEDNRILYRVRLGQPAGELLVPKGAEPVFRAYDLGIVAVNPGLTSTKLKIPLIPSVREPVDLYHCRLLKVRDNSFEAEIPAESGRVYVDRTAALRAHLEEARFHARRLLKQSAEVSIPRWAIRDTRHANGQGEVSLDTQDVHSDKASLKVFCEGNGSEVHCHQGVAVNQTTAAPLKIRTWERTDGGTDGILTLGVQFTDGTNTWWSLPPLHANKWTLVEDVYNPEKPVRAVTLFCIPDYAKAGTAWFDDIAIFARDDKGGFLEQNLVANPGFEEGVTPCNTPGELEQAVRILNEAVALLADGRTMQAVETRLRDIPELVGPATQSMRRALSIAAGISMEVSIESRRLPIGDSLTAVVRVFNDSSSAARVGEARFELPTGLAARALSRAPVTVRPGKSAGMQYALSRGGEFDRPYAWFNIEVPVTLRTGHVISVPASTAVRFGKPVELKAERPAVGRGREGEIVVVAANHTHQALDGFVTLRAPSFMNLTTPRKRATVPPLSEARIRFRVSPSADAATGNADLEMRFEVPKGAEEGDVSLPYVPGSAAAPGQDESKLLAQEKAKIRVVPILSAHRVSVAPKVDGRLDEAVWESVGVSQGFHLMDGSAMAKVQTTVRVMYDNRALYVGIQCSRQLMQNIKANARPGAADEADQVVRDDHVELFVDPGWTMKEYLRLCCNAIGGHKTSGNPNAKWLFTAGKSSDGYTIEAALNLRSIRVKPKKGEVWGLNVSRIDSEGAPGLSTELSCWSPTGETFHNPAAFGLLVFE